MGIVEGLYGLLLLLMLGISIESLTDRLRRRGTYEEHPINITCVSMLPTAVMDIIFRHHDFWRVKH